MSLNIRVTAYGQKPPQNVHNSSLFNDNNNNDNNNDNNKNITKNI